MRILICNVLFLLGTLHGTISAQNTFSSVKGKVLSEMTGEGIESVAISLVNASDSSLKQGTLTDDNGKFSLEKIDSGKYYLKVQYIGYEESGIQDLTLLPGINATLPDIILKTALVLLKEVTIHSHSETYYTSFDSKTYYPENDLMSKSGTASDLLQNIPSVSTDEEDEISLRGSTNVTILINGKPSLLMNTNSAVALQQLPANIIERIEIITNPPANYKPDGTAGVINIVLKKGYTSGYNGSVNLNAGTHDRYNGNIALNINPGKLNLFTSYSYLQYNSLLSTKDERIIYDTLSGESLNYSAASKSTGIPASHTLHAGLDYQFNKQTKGSLGGNIFSLSKTENETGIVRLSNSSAVVQNLFTQATFSEKEYEWEALIGLEHAFKKPGHELQLESNYSTFSEKGDIILTTGYIQPIQPVDLSKISTSKTGRLTTVTAEHIYPFNNELDWESGIEGEYVSGEIFYAPKRFDSQQGVWVSDGEFENKFSYDQQLHSIYTLFTKEVQRFQLQAGARAEYMKITSHLVGQQQQIQNTYFKIYPSVHIGFNIDEEKMLGISYSKRINRPDPDELNPYFEYVDAFNVESGNPKLAPEQVHAIELEYELKHEKFLFSPSLYYKFTYDVFTDRTTTLDSNLLLTTIDNISKEKLAGISTVFSRNGNRSVRFSCNVDVYYNVLEELEDGIAESSAAVSWETKINTSIRIVPTTQLQLNATYRSAILTSEGKYLPLYFVNIGLKKSLLKNKASLVLSASDIFNTLERSEEIDDDELQQQITRKRRSQIFTIGFTWQFGLSVKETGEEIKFEEN